MYGGMVWNFPGGKAAPAWSIIIVLNCRYPGVYLRWIRPYGVYLRCLIAKG